MSDKYQCLNCAYLSNCAETDVEKAATGYYCARWEAARAETVQARNQIIQSFGHQGLYAVLKTEIKEV